MWAPSHLVVMTWPLQSVQLRPNALTASHQSKEGQMLGLTASFSCWRSWQRFLATHGSSPRHMTQAYDPGETGAPCTARSTRQPRCVSLNEHRERTEASTGACSEIERCSCCQGAVGAWLGKCIAAHWEPSRPCHDLGCTSGVTEVRCWHRKVDRRLLQSYVTNSACV